MAISLPTNAAVWLTTSSTLQTPGSNDLTLSCDVPGINLIGAGIGNSSPVFRTLPPVRVCRNTTFNIDFSATDADGDSLAYRLVSCLRGGSPNNPKPTVSSTSFLPLSYAPSFSPQAPFGPSGSLTIDPRTGIGAGSSDVRGYYALSVACDEYRGGVRIATVTRTYVLLVMDCGKDVNAQIAKDSVLIQGVSIVRCAGTRTISFRNQSAGAIVCHWDFGVNGRDDDTSALSDPQFSYPAAGRYPLTLIAYGAGCADTLHSFVWLSDDVVTADFTQEGGLCVLDTLLLTDHSTSTGSAIVQHPGMLLPNFIPVIR